MSTIFPLLSTRSLDIKLIPPDSWNRNLTYARAHGIGGEFYRKGITVALAPAVVGPLGRVAQGGRNWEGFSNDPFLAGILAAETVRGAQDQGVIACTKHFVGNEQEIGRNPLEARAANNKTIESLSTNFDDKAMHELYMWPFADAIHAGTSSISMYRIIPVHETQDSDDLQCVPTIGSTTATLATIAIL